MDANAEVDDREYRSYRGRRARRRVASRWSHRKSPYRRAAPVDRLECNQVREQINGTGNAVGANEAGEI